MYESNKFLPRSQARVTVNQAHSIAFELLKRCLQVWHGKGEVMEPLPATGHETRNGRILRGGFKQLDPALPDRERRDADSLVSHDFFRLRSPAQQHLKDRDRRLQRFHRDPNVMNFHNGNRSPIAKSDWRAVDFKWTSRDPGYYFRSWLFAASRPLWIFTDQVLDHGIRVAAAFENLLHKAVDGTIPQPLRYNLLK